MRRLFLLILALVILSALGYTNAMSGTQPIEASQSVSASEATGLTNTFDTIPDNGVDAIAERVLSRNVPIALGSDKGVRKIAIEDSFSFTKPAGVDDYTYTFAHNLPYAPAVEVYLEGLDRAGLATNFPLPHPTVTSGPSGLQILSIVSADSDTKNLYIRFRSSFSYDSGGASVANPQFSVAIPFKGKFFLYQATAN